MSTVMEPAIESWLQFKRTAERVRAAIIADVTAQSEVPESELTVLIHLAEAGGSLRQNALANLTGWDRTRLSHLLTRMERAGRLRRARLRNGVELHLEPTAAGLVDSTRPMLAEAAERHLSQKLTPAQRRSLRQILDALDA